MPHASIQVDTFKDKTIQAGSIIIPNVWQVFGAYPVFSLLLIFKLGRWLAMCNIFRIPTPSTRTAFLTSLRRTKPFTHWRRLGLMTRLLWFLVSDAGGINVKITFAWFANFWCYRICPGRFLADANAWLIIANILAVYDIMPAIDPKTGKEILPEFGWANGGLAAWVLYIS